MCYNLNLLHFELQVLCYNKELCVSWCYFSNYGFCVVVFKVTSFSLVHFQVISFVFCVSLLHFELGITILLLFVLHMSCVTTIPKKNWNQSIKFSFLFHPFDQSYIFFWNCLWTLCATIALTTIVLNFVEASNDKLFIFSSCDFACICEFSLAIRVGFLWFHVCVFLVL
jgi:hypothetical protein